MRRAMNDGGMEADGEAPAEDPAGPEPAGPERKCIVTGAVLPKSALIRFGVGPDGVVVPDIGERLPGRGLWLTARRDILVQAVTKRAFARAARRNVEAPRDLPEQVERLLRHRCRDLVGLARGAGQVVAGFEKVAEALRRGGVAVLLAASDGAEGGRAKLRALARGVPEVEVLTGAELGGALGREFVVHAALAPGGLAEKFLAEAGRLIAYSSPAEGPPKKEEPNAQVG